MLNVNKHGTKNKTKTKNKKKEKCGEHNKNHSSKPEYQESHKNSSQKQYWSKKDVTWWSGPFFFMAEYSSHFITFNSNTTSS
jgi:hypothetical protein